MSQEQTIKYQLSQWVAKQSSTHSDSFVEYDCPIIEKRVITSVQIMDLILYLEFLRGEPVNPEQIKPGAFSTINAIYNHFFTGAVAHA